MSETNPTETNATTEYTPAVPTASAAAIPTPPLELTLKGADKVVAYACGVCRCVVAPSDPAPDVDARYRRDAAEHCQFTCLMCGETKPRGEAGNFGWGPDCRRLCAPCGSRHLAELAERQDHARIAAAPKLTEVEWTAAVAAGRFDSSLWHDDRGFDLEELREHCLDAWDGDPAHDPFPEYVEACVGRTFHMDAASLVEAAFDCAEMPEGVAEDHAPSDADVADLQAALDAWTTPLGIAWYETSGHLVLLDAAENARALAEVQEAQREAASIERGELMGERLP